MTMKVMEFASFDEFEECENKQDYEMVAVVHNKKRNTVCADMITNCKRWRTAVNRFFEALENYPEFDGWKDSIMESCENGFFSDKEVHCGCCGWFWEVSEHDGSFYICVNVLK